MTADELKKLAEAASLTGAQLVGMSANEFAEAQRLKQQFRQRRACAEKYGSGQRGGDAGVVQFHFLLSFMDLRSTERPCAPCTCPAALEPPSEPWRASSFKMPQ